MEAHRAGLSRIRARVDQHELQDPEDEWEDNEVHQDAEGFHLGSPSNRREGLEDLLSQDQRPTNPIFQEFIFDLENFINSLKPDDQAPTFKLQPSQLVCASFEVKLH